MVALNLDHSVFDGSAGTAHGFEFLAHGCQGIGIECEPFDQGDSLPFSAFGLAGDAHVAVTDG